MSYSGTYRGIRFRSLLELSAIRLFEEGGGHVLGSTMLYEATRIPYGRGLRRTYIVDLTFPQTKRLIEIKPESRVKGKRNVAKRLAAEAWARREGWTYELVTDRDLRAVDSLLTLAEAARISEVRLDGRALKALGRKRKRKRR
jgi:hypothetical protein